MRRHATFTSGLVAMLALLCVGGCSSASRPSGTPIDAATAHATFEQVWKAVDTGDADATHGGVDWNRVKTEFEPRADACTTREQLRAVLDEMLARLGRSHFGISASRATGSSSTEAAKAARDPGTFGLTLRRLGDAVVVTDVREAFPAAQAGVRRGWIVRRIDDSDPIASTGDAPAHGPMVRYAPQAAAQALDRGPADSSERWVFIDAGAVEHRCTLKRVAMPDASAQFGALTVPRATCSDQRLATDELAALGVPTDLRISVIAFNIWMPSIAGDIDAAIDRHRDADGIVLDLRGNPGGVGAMSMGVAGHFHDAPDSLGTMRTRDTTLEFRVNPRRSTADGREVKPFAGPLVILVDPLTASTSEIFAAGLQSLGRAKVVGRASAGAALPAQMRELPSGDVLLFAFADFTTPDGRHIEGAGVQPDEPCGEQPAAWASGIDPDMQAAARRISSMLRDRDCH